MRAFVVDDDRQVREFVQTCLENLGHTVVTFADPRDLLKQYRTGGEQADVVFTDFHMPMMNGLTLAVHLRTVNSKLPIVMLTGAEETRKLNRDLGCPVRTIVIKPFGVTEIKQALAAAGVTHGKADNGEGTTAQA